MRWWKGRSLGSCEGRSGLAEALPEGALAVRVVEEVQVELQNLLFAADDGSDDGEWPPTEPRRR